AILDSPDRAVGQGSYGSFGGPLGPQIAIKITKIAGMIKGVDLALAAFHRLVKAGNASQQHRQASGRIARSDDVFAPRRASLEFHTIEQASQFVFVMEAKAIQLPTQRLQRASVSRLHQTGHGSPLRFPRDWSLRYFG